MKKFITSSAILALLSFSCYTKIKAPDYQFMNVVKSQASLDSSLKTMIELTPKKYYYGSLPATKIITGSFYVKNTGNKDFNIVSIKPDCNCISVHFENLKIIQPLDSLKITYEMKTEGFSGIFRNTITTIGNCQNGNQTYYFEGKY